MTKPQPLPPDGPTRPNEDLPDPGPPTAPPGVPDMDPTPGLVPGGDVITPGREPGIGGPALA